MANLYVFYDGRSARRDGSGTLKLALRHNGQTVYESLDIHIKKDEWEESNMQIVSRADKKFLNIMLRKKFTDAMAALSRLEHRPDFITMSARDALTMIVRGTDIVDAIDDGDYVLPVFNEYITLAKKATTAGTYRTTLSSMKKFEPDIDSLRFRDINVAWLRRYQNWLTEERKMSVNGANVYLRNLRTIFNYAQQNNYTVARYPFKDIDMSTQEPDKKEIPYRKFLEWVSYPLTDGRAFYRDLFMLSFYLCGIRPIDLLHVKKDQIEEGRLVYWPEKLNGRTKLSIKIEPEAQKLIDKYAGEEYMLNIMESREDYKEFCKHWNKALKAVGEDEIVHKTGRRGRAYYNTKHHGVVPYIRAYYARTCWASYAYNELDLPMDTISQALGHKSGLRVTNFYVKRDTSKVDKANRMMLDRLKQDLKEFKKRVS